MAQESTGRQASDLIDFAARVGIEAFATIDILTGSEPTVTQIAGPKECLPRAGVA